MALKATVFKVGLDIADLDRRYYQRHDLTIARHPSETDERMMVRVLAFACHASDRLEFTRGLSADDEPDLWQKSLNGELDVWIDVGLPDAKRIRKACHRARQVIVYSYGGRAASLWWSQIHNLMGGLDNLRVVNLPPTDSQHLATLVERTMTLQCTRQENQLWISTESANLCATLEAWQSGSQ